MTLSDISADVVLNQSMLASKTVKADAPQKTALVNGNQDKVIAADYVIFGAGVAGLATAAFLRKRLTKANKIIVVERGSLEQTKVAARKAAKYLSIDKAAQGAKTPKTEPDATGTVLDVAESSAQGSSNGSSAINAARDGRATTLQQNGEGSRPRNVGEETTAKADYGITIAPNGTCMLSMLSNADLVQTLDGSELKETLVRGEDNPDSEPLDFIWGKIVNSPSIFCRRSRLLGYLYALCTEPSDALSTIDIIENRKIVYVSNEADDARDDQGYSYTAKLFICADGINKIGRQVVRRANDAKLPNETQIEAYGEESYDDNAIQCAYMAIIPRHAVEAQPSLRAVLLGKSGSPSILANWIYDPAVDVVRHDSAKAAVDALSDPPEERQRRIILYPVDAEGNFQLFAYYRCDEDMLKQFHWHKRQIQAESHGDGTGPTRLGMIRNVEADDAIKEFSMFHKDLQSLFRSAPSIDLCLIRDTDPLFKWEIDGRAVVIGDAAHAVSPHTGQGASQVLEDAEALSLWLSVYENAGSQTIPLQTFLQLFESIRMPRAERVTEVARLASGLKPGLATLDVAQYCQYVMGWKGVEAYWKADNAAMWDGFRQHDLRTNSHKGDPVLPT